MDTSTVLTAEHLKVRYRNGSLGIIDVSLSVDAGEIIALIGPNGAGKTTTVRVISGFLRSEGARVIGGRVRLFGNDVTNAEPHRMTRLGVGFVPERSKVFTAMSVEENLKAIGDLPPRSRRDELTAHVFELFPSLAERRHAAAGQLSGGQQQMLAIGTCLMMRPRLMVIDEMTLGLHLSVHSVLYEAVKAVAAEGTAVIVVDETIGRVLEGVARCYVLEGGCLKWEGPPSAFDARQAAEAGIGDQMSVES